MENNKLTVIDVIRAGKYVGFADIPDEEYFAAPYASNSFLSRAKQKSFYHAHYERMTGADTSTPAKDFGRNLHLAVLERSRFNDLFVCGPDCRRGTKEWKAFEEEHHGKQILKPDEYDTLIRMVQAIDSHSTASKLLSGGLSEQAMFWQDPATGVMCKGKVDYLKDDILTDLKTTTDGSYKAFERDVHKYGYHRQSAFYLDGYFAVTEKRTNIFPHVVIEKSPPFAVSVYLLDDGTLDKGREEYLHLLNQYKFCNETGEWAGYPDEIQAMALPHYAWGEEI